MWVLIVVFGFWTEAATSVTQEFSSKEACMLAQQEIIKQVNNSNNISIKVKLCTRK